MKKIVTVLSVICLAQTASADEFVSCFNHKGETILKGVLSDFNIKEGPAGLLINGRSRVGRGYAVNDAIANKLGLDSVKKCRDIHWVFEAVSEYVTLFCATAQVTHLKTKMPTDELADLNQKSVIERLSEQPECTAVVSKEKIELVRASFLGRR
jgi:hypothetical protein